MSKRTQMLTPGRRRRRERLIRPERHAPAFLSQNARGGQPIRGRERSSRSIYRQGRSAPFTGINNSRDHTIGRRLRGSRCLAPSGWAVTFKPIGPVGRKRLAVVEAEQDRPTALAIGEHAGGLADPIGQQAYVEATGVEVVEVELVDDKPVLAECACPPRLQPRPPYADRHETFCFDDRRRGDQGDKILEKGAARQNKIAHVYALLQFAHASGEQGPIVALTGHIVIHHRCRSRLVGGAEAPSGCGTTYSNSVSVFQSNEIANPEIEPDADCGSGGAKPSSSRLRRSPSAARRFGAESVRTPWLGECRSGQKKTSRRDWFRRKAAARYDWHTLRNNPTKRNTARRRSSVENSILGAVRPPRAADGPSPCDTPQSQGQRSQGATLPTWTALGR